MSSIATRTLAGELVDEPAGRVRVLVLHNPFTLERSTTWVAEGATLSVLLQGLGLRDWQSALVAIDGHMIPRQWWSRVRPRAEHLVTVRVVPRGGGDSGTKGWIQIAAGVVLIVVGIILACTLWGAPFAPYVITMGVGLLLSGAMTLIFPPPTLPKLKDTSSNDQPVFSITGSRNVANPYGAVTRVYGRHRIFPNYGALPYTEIAGNTQYVRMLFVPGYGPLQLSEMKIGETPLTEYDEVEVEVREGYLDDEPVTLFPGSVIEDPQSVLLADAPVGTMVVRRTNGEVDEWSTDFVFEGGLFHLDPDGRIAGATARILIWQRKVGDVDWTLLSDTVYSDNNGTAQPLRRTFRKVVETRAIYDVRMQQIGGRVQATAPGQKQNAATWRVLRSVLNEDPITLPGLCKVAIRIQATDQLNGVVDQFNCIAESVLPDYEASSNTWPWRVTANPASIFRDVLQGSANARPVADVRVDIDSLAAWHTECVATGRTFNFVVEQQTTVAELLRQVAAVGRASLGSPDGRFGVVREVLQSVPVQHFTPRNSREFKGSKLFREIPHALRVRFINPDAGWDVDERIVYADGYSAANASKFEAMQFFGITDPEQAFKEARYHLAQATLRPELYEFVTDVEHLVCTRGDLIRVTHDVPLWGVGFGRLKAVAVTSGILTGVTSDEPMLIETGVNYEIRIRRADGSSLLAAVTASQGAQTVFTLVTPVEAFPLPSPGDLFGFGAVGESSVEALVTKVEMLKDMGARITCVDAAPAIHSADGGPIPAHDPQITIPPTLRKPPLPQVFALTSDGTMVSRAGGGALGSRIIVRWVFSGTYPSTDILDGALVQAAWRVSGASTDAPWIRAISDVQAEANVIEISPMIPGDTIDVRLRSISRYGTPSAWVVITLIELPNPPVSVTYTLTAIAGGYLARVGQTMGPPAPHRVTGLRLVNSISGSPNDTTFAGTEAKFAWNATALYTGNGDSEDNLTEDNEIRDYLVEIVTNGLTRHSTSTASPSYVYTYEQNLEDHAGVPARVLMIRVWARGQDGQRSLFAAELTVQNPPPDMSQVAPQVMATFEALIVDWKAYQSSDYDLNKFEMLVAAASPPSTVVATRAPSQREAIIPGLTAGTPLFVQVMPHDAFGAGIGSQIVTATPMATANIDMFTRSFTPQGIVFGFDPVTRSVTWTAGTLQYTLDGTTVETHDLQAGSAVLPPP